MWKNIKRLVIIMLGRSQYQPINQCIPPEGAVDMQSDIAEFTEPATFSSPDRDNNISVAIRNDDNYSDDQSDVSTPNSNAQFTYGLHTGSTRPPLEMGIYQAQYASKKTEENIKFVVSSFIFIAIIVLVIVIAFAKNPSMS